MNIEDPTKVSDHIIHALGNGPLPTLDLVETVMTSHPKNPTKQGVYKALRELKSTKVVSIVKGVVSLHSHWMDYMSHFITLAKFHAQEQVSEKNFLQLQEGERISYHFNSAKEADVFWDHVFGYFIDIMKPEEALFTYTPHDWTVLTSHYEAELQLARKLLTKNIPYLATVGYRFPFDKLTKKKFKILKNIQYNNLEKPFSEKIDYYFTIFGNFIVEVFPDKSTAQTIHEFFKTGNSFTEEKESELEKIISKRGKVRMVISHNAKKAEKLKKKLQKDFYIPQK